MNWHFHRIATVVTDCSPAIALTSGALLPRAQAAAQTEPALASLRWCAVEEIPSDLSSLWTPPQVDEHSIAFLQYTSGSTAQPKGVMVSHGNLVANEKMIQRAFGVTENDVILGWLPLFHDMGLIGNVLQALWSGARCVLFSPATFLRRPLSWLQAITKYRATISGGPNFAYDWCTAKITDKELETLHLSSWRIAFNGSEPVRAQTLSEFSQRFLACGFDPGAFFPCYGLAEATLFVSGRSGNAPRIVAVSSDSLSHHEFRVSSENSSAAHLLVSSGSAAADEEIAIIDPETLLPCGPGKIGEVWVSGPHIARGYWNQPETSGGVLNAHTDQGNRPYLRTGDLGYLLDGELFITGRMKDLIIVRGRNHYPQDLEFTVAQSHAAFAGSAGAAFTIDIDGTSQPVLVQEVAVNSKALDLEGLLRVAVQAIAEEHEIQMHAIALVPAGSLPKTSSGKIRRQECRRQFLSSEMKVLANTAAVPPRNVNSVNGTTHARILLENTLQTVLAEILKLPPREIDTTTALTAYGLDSLQTAELNNRIAKTWDLELPLEELTEVPTIASVAALIEDKLQQGAEKRSGSESLGGDLREWPLSHGQRAMVYLYRLAPHVAAYHIPLGLRIQGALDVQALQRAMEELVHRHECLRSVFITGDNGMVQRLVAPVAPFQLEDAKHWTEQQMQAHLKTQIGGAFDLERGPLFRAVLFRRSSQEHVLLLVFHHITLRISGPQVACRPAAAGGADL
jgi:acyl-CoA synthetase (AMP-forming)/AMP-acid ligase II/acyl carrier protein